MLTPQPITPALQDASIEEIGEAVVDFTSLSSSLFPAFLQPAVDWKLGKSFENSIRDNWPRTKQLLIGAAKIANALHHESRVLAVKIGKILDTEQLPEPVQDALNQINDMTPRFQKGMQQSRIEKNNVVEAPPGFVKEMDDYDPASGGEVIGNGIKSHPWTNKIKSALQVIDQQMASLQKIPLKIEGKKITLDRSSSNINPLTLLLLQYAGMSVQDPKKVTPEMQDAILKQVGSLQDASDSLSAMYSQLKNEIGTQATLPDFSRQALADVIADNINYLIGLSHMRKDCSFSKLLSWVNKTPQDIKPTQNILEATFLVYGCCDFSDRQYGSTPKAEIFVNAVQAAVEDANTETIQAAKEALTTLQENPSAPFARAREEFNRQLELLAQGKASDQHTTWRGGVAARTPQSSTTRNNASIRRPERPFP